MDKHELICREAQYIIKNNATVRQTGKYFGRSKSIIHRDMREKLPHISYTLAVEVSKILDANLTERTMRGGLATKAKWEKVRNN